MNESERSKILEIAALREVMPGTPGYVLLEKPLHTRPSEHAFDVCWRVIRAMFAAWPEEKRRTLEVSLPAYAVEVARMSGGLLGFRSISNRREDPRCSALGVKLPKLTLRLPARLPPAPPSPAS